jgi:hypothetical protein
MERVLAESLVREFMALSEPFNRLTQLSFQLPEERAKELRRVLGECYGRLYGEFVLPVVAQYPDLDPDPPPT